MCVCQLGIVWQLHMPSLTLSFLVHLYRAEAKLLEETARPLIDTLGEVTDIVYVLCIYTGGLPVCVHVLYYYEFKFC